MNTCLGYYWRQSQDEIYGCANSINDGKYAYNNLAAYYLTWYHKFNSRWHTDTEAWYQYMSQTTKYLRHAAGGNELERGVVQSRAAKVLRAGMGDCQLCGASVREKRLPLHSQ